jgi:hypothetical protein
MPDACVERYGGARGGQRSALVVDNCRAGPRKLTLGAGIVDLQSPQGPMRGVGGMVALVLAVGDAAPGFHAVAHEVWPETREHSCWCHKC